MSRRHFPIRTALLFLVSAGSLLVCPRPAFSATTVYTNESDFVAALGILPVSLNEFTNPNYFGWLAHPLRSSTNGIDYYIISEPPLRLVGYDGAVSTHDTNDSILVYFSSSNITGVGGYFYAADQNASLISGSVTVSLDDGTLTNVASSAGAAPNFVGFLSDGPIYNSLNVTNSSGPGYPALSHLYVVDGIPTPAIALTTSNSLLISWYAAPTGFVLQVSMDGLQTWTNTVPTPTLLGNYFQVQVPFSGPAGFFRLAK